MHRASKQGTCVVSFTRPHARPLHHPCTGTPRATAPGRGMAAWSQEDGRSRWGQAAVLAAHTATLSAGTSAPRHVPSAIRWCRWLRRRRGRWPRGLHTLLLVVLLHHRVRPGFLRLLRRTRGQGAGPGCTPRRFNLNPVLAWLSPAAPRRSPHARLPPHLQPLHLGRPSCEAVQVHFPHASLAAALRWGLGHSHLRPFAPAIHRQSDVVVRRVGRGGGTITAALPGSTPPGPAPAAGEAGPAAQRSSGGSHMPDGRRLGGCCHRHQTQQHGDAAATRP